MGLTMNTARTRETERIAAAAQALDPYNRDDAEYIAAHPHEFDAETLRIALSIEPIRNLEAERKEAQNELT